MNNSPHVISYSPTGALNDPNVDISIVFDTAMDPDLTNANFTITPSRPYEIHWPNPSQMNIYSALSYDTSYRVRLLGVSRSHYWGHLPIGWEIISPPEPPPPVEVIPESISPPLPTYFPVSSRGFTLTFDDCGTPSQIWGVINALDAKGYKALMFPTGRCRDQFPWLVSTLIAHGHIVCNHSYSHPVLTRLSDAAINSEIRSGVHANCSYFRPPYGATTPHIAYLANSQGYTQLLWDVDTRDWAGTSSSNMVYMIHSHGGIVLMHFHGFHTIEAIYGL